MTKKPAAGRSAAAKAPWPPRPRSLDLALIAIGVQVFFSIARGALTWAYTSSLRQSLVDSNKAKKKPLDLCNVRNSKGCLDVNKQVHLSQILLLASAVLLSLLILLSVRTMLRGTRSGRAMYIAISLVGAFIGFAGSPLSILAVIGGGPVPLTVATGLAGVGSLVAIVVLFRPDAKVFFTPAGTAAGAAPRPGLSSLFGPKQPRGPRPGAGVPRGVPARGGARATAGSAAGSAGRAEAAERPTVASARSRAKMRSDAEAKGAALARSRAKASKSRRTDV